MLPPHVDPPGIAPFLKPRHRFPSLQPKFRSNWKGTRPDNRQTAKRNNPRRLPRRKITWTQYENQAYQPPRLQDLQFQNRLKASRYFPKRFNHRALNASRAPGAPLNSTSYLMRAKNSGGLDALVSPIPATPAVILTPVLSPLPHYKGLVDEANKEWGVNGYGSMKGLIRLRSSEFGKDQSDSESDVEQGTHVQSVQQLEQRLDQDLNRFVMTYPSSTPQNDGQNLLETRMDDQDSHIAHLEEENITLKDRLYFMQHEVEDLRRRMQILEGGGALDEKNEACSERSTADVSFL